MVEQTDWGESEIRGPVHLFRERLLMRLFRPLLTQGVVLDAGCGSGSWRSTCALQATKLRPSKMQRHLSRRCGQKVQASGLARAPARAARLGNAIAF